MHHRPDFLDRVVVLAIILQLVACSESRDAAVSLASVEVDRALAGVVEVASGPELMPGSSNRLELTVGLINRSSERRNVAVDVAWRDENGDQQFVII